MGISTAESLFFAFEEWVCTAACRNLFFLYKFAFVEICPSCRPLSAWIPEGRGKKCHVSSNQTDIKLFNGDFKRYYQRCVLFAKSYTHDTAQAECMAAEAMALLWEKRAAGECIEQVLPYLFSVIRNKALHFLRRESLRYQIHGTMESDTSREIRSRIDTLEACDPHALYAEDVQTILHRSLESLGTQTRRVFMLSRFEGLSNRQIAQELGISEKSVEYHMTRALRQLRIDLKDYLPLVALLLGL